MFNENADGGYYAIKGFLYQFDKTIIEILNNPNSDVNFENIQDVDYDDYVLQIKHRETAQFQNNKVKKPIVQLIKLFMKDNSKKYCLYCYFYDKKPTIWKLTLDELNNILGNESNNYLDLDKNLFLQNFKIEFTFDYDLQFNEVINLIKKNFGLRDVELTIIYHAIIRSILLDLSIKEKNFRTINKSSLINHIKSTEKIIFTEAYSKHMGESEYNKLIKKEYFTFKAANVENFERLFILEYDDKVERTIILKILIALCKKYCIIHKTGVKSPAPYIVFKNFDNEMINEIKNELFDISIIFCDGTNFNGSKFRLNEILKDYYSNKAILKILPIENLNDLLYTKKIKEIYDFSYFPITINWKNSRYINIQTNNVEQILSFL